MLCVLEAVSFLKFICLDFLSKEKKTVRKREGEFFET